MTRAATRSGGDGARGRHAVAARMLHPLAWWVWALALGAAALRTTNPLLLGLLLAVAWVVVAARRPDAPWARSFGVFVRFGMVIVVLRIVLQVLFGQRLPGTVLFTIPEVQLPAWAASVSLGGPVTSEALVAAFNEGLQLAVLLACVGAANSLASPYRLLRVVPSVLYELGVVVTVAFSFAPQTVSSLAGVRDARRLRGRPNRGWRGMRGMAVPVLEGALERSLELAASMDSRGYGRRGEVPARRRLVGRAVTLVGALSVLIGTFGFLYGGAPAMLGLPLLAAGAALLALGMQLARANAARSRYRPDPWLGPEWVTVMAGITAAGGCALAAHLGVEGLRPAYSPLVAPTLPLLPAVAILVAVLPAFATPPVPAAVVATDVPEPPVVAADLVTEGA